MRRIYLAHAFAADPSTNIARVRSIARHLALAGHLPLASQLYLPNFLDDATERELAMQMCLQLVALADEVRVFGHPSAGMLLEIAEAERLGIPVVRGKHP